MNIFTKKLLAFSVLSFLSVNQIFAMENMSQNSSKIELSEEMKMKLNFDYIVNLPIMMRAVFNNAKHPDLNLTKEQIIAIRDHKINVMDNIEPIMKEAHMLSIQLKEGLINGKISNEEGFKLATKITNLKEQVLMMKITCINFVKSTLTPTQFQKLIEIDKKAMYKNNPYE